MASLNESAVMPVWQAPFIEVIKFGMTHRTIGWYTQGHVEQTQDKQIHKSIYKIRGAIAATNFLRVPRNVSKGSHGLGLTGRFVYLQVRRIKDQSVTIHLDFITNKKTVLRFTLSSIYDLFRSTGTVLRVPLSLDARWTTIVVDMVGLLKLHLFNQYARDTYRHLKAITLCASMNLRNCVVSATLYTSMTLPPSLRFPSNFEHQYRWLPLPQDGVLSPDVVNHQHFIPKKQEDLRIAAPPTPITSTRQSLNTPTDFDHNEPEGAEVSPVHESHVDTNATVPRPSDVASENAMQSQVVDPKVAKMQESSPLAYSTTQQEVGTAIVSARIEANEPNAIVKLERIIGFSNDHSRMLLWVPNGSACIYTSFSTIIYREMWAATIHPTKSNHSKYPLDEIDQSFKSTKGENASIESNAPTFTTKEHFLYGHDAAISALAITFDGHYLASAELPSTRKQPGIRLWDLACRECLFVVKAPAKGVTGLCFSRFTDRLLLCIVGRDACFRTQLCIWDCVNLHKGSLAAVRLVARQTSDFPIDRIDFSPYEERDHYHLVSCGRENIRYWRVNPKSSHLTGSPVILNAYARGTVFTDLGFDPFFETHPSNISRMRPLYVTSSLGTLLVLDYDSKDIVCVYQLHDARINCLSINEGFCVTGSEDSFLRVWPLDFSDFFLEAQHEAGIQCLDVSADGMQVLVGSRNHAIGVLDISSRNYVTLLRSHTKKITTMVTAPWPVSLLLDEVHEATVMSELVTASADNTLRVWDLLSGNQLFEFDFQQDIVTSLAASPVKRGIVAVGFASGYTRIFDLSSPQATPERATLHSNMLHELKQHQSLICHIAYDSKAHHLFTSGQGNQLCLYDAQQQDYVPLKMVLADFDPKDGHFQLSHNGKWLALISSDHHDIVMLNPYSLRIILKLQLPKQRQEETVKLVRFLHHSSKLLALSANDRLSIFSLPDREWVHSFSLRDQNGITSLAMSVNEKYMASGGADGSICVWKWNDKRQCDQSCHSFLGHEVTVNDLAFTKDGHYLVATGDGSAIGIWRVHGDLTLPNDIEAGDEKSGADVIVDENSSQRSNLLAESPATSNNFRLSLEADAFTLDLETVQPKEDTSVRTNSTRCHEIDVPPTVVTTTANFCGDLVLSRTIGGVCPSTFAWSYSTGKLLTTIGSVLVIEDIASGEQKFYNDFMMDPTDEIVVLQLSPSGAYVALISSHMECVVIRSIPCSKNVESLATEDGNTYHEDANIQIKLFQSTRAVTCLAFAQCVGPENRDDLLCLACEIDPSQYAIAIASIAQERIVWSSQNASGEQVGAIRQIVATSDSQFLLLSADHSSLSTLSVHWDTNPHDSGKSLEAEIAPLIGAFPSQVQLVSLYSKQSQFDRLRYLVGIDNDRYCYFYDLQHRTFVATTQLLISAKPQRSNNQIDDKVSSSSSRVEVMEWVTTAGKSMLITGTRADNMLNVHALPMLSTKHSARTQVDWQRVARAGVSLMCQIALPRGESLRGLSVDHSRGVGIATTSNGTAVLVHFDSSLTPKVIREAATSSNQHSRSFPTITDASWALNGAVFLSISEKDHAIRVWLPELAKEIATFTVDAAICTCFAVNPFSTTPDGVPQSMVMAGYSNGSFRVFDLCDMRLLSKFELPLSPTKSARNKSTAFVRIVFVGAYVALVVTNDSRVFLVNIANGLFASDEASSRNFRVRQPISKQKHKKVLKQRSRTKVKPRLSKNRSFEYRVVYQEISLIPSSLSWTRGEQVDMDIGTIEVMESSDVTIHPFLLVVKYTGPARYDGRCVVKVFADPAMAISRKGLMPTDEWMLKSSYDLDQCVATFKMPSLPESVLVMYSCKTQQVDHKGPATDCHWSLKVRDCVERRVIEHIVFDPATLLDIPVALCNIKLAFPDESEEAKVLMLDADGRMAVLDIRHQRLLPINTWTFQCLQLKFCRISKSFLFVSPTQLAIASIKVYKN